MKPDARSSPFASPGQAARARVRADVAAAACGIALATLLEVFVIARYEPHAHDGTASATRGGDVVAPPAGDAAATPSPPDFDASQRVLPDELPPDF